MSEKKTLMDLIGDIDRRVVFGFLFLALVGPLIISIPLPLPVTGFVKQYHEFLESIPAGAVVGFDVELTGATDPQLGPDLTLVFIQLFRRDVKSVIWCMTAESPVFATNAINNALKTLGEKGATKKYGVDWVELGYIAGTETGLTALMTGIRQVISKDMYGKALDDLPAMKNVNTGKDFYVVIWHSGSAGSVPYGIRQINGRFGTPMLVAVTSNEFPLYVTYLAAGQIRGLIGGARGAAEHETLMKTAGLATAQTSALALGGVVILAMLLLGNISYLDKRRRQRK